MTPKYKDWIDGKIIDHDSQRPMDYVDHLLDEYYNSMPSSLIDIPVSERDRGDMAYYDELGKSLAGKIDPTKPIGKQVL